uniref:Uncharacterized protein n=1 Tax=Dendroctonus ponderosae TaxID=77166 RepID=J3JT73_DENPD|nr:unknown [Dendroctonus ponderosae]
MAKHVGFLLLIGIGLSAIAAASYGGSIGELEFADIEEHLESLTSASTSIGDIKDAVVPYLNNWRSKRSSSSSVENAGIDSWPLRSISTRVKNFNIGGKLEKIIKSIEDFVAKIIKKIRHLILPAVKMLNMEKVFRMVDTVVTKLLKPFGINLEENAPHRMSVAKFVSGFGDLF